MNHDLNGILQTIKKMTLLEKLIIIPTIPIYIPFLLIKHYIIDKWKERNLSKIDYCIVGVKKLLKSERRPYKTHKDFMSLNYYITKYDPRLFLIQMDEENCYLTALGHASAGASLDYLYDRLKSLNELPIQKYMPNNRKINVVTLSETEYIKADEFRLLFSKESEKYFIGYSNNGKMSKALDKSARLTILNHISEELLINKNIDIREFSSNDYPYTLATIDKLEAEIRSI